VLERLWQRVVALEIISGRLHAPDFEFATDDYFGASFLFPQWESLNPLDETKADVMAIEAGIASRHQIIAARGRDPEEVDRNCRRPIHPAIDRQPKRRSHPIGVSKMPLAFSNKLLSRDIGDILEVRDAVTRPRTFSAAARTVEVIAATTTPVSRRDAQGEFDEVLDLRGADLDALIGAPVLNGHRSEGIDNILGSVIDARVEGDQIIATLQISERADPAVLRDIGEGVINSVSLGYQVARWQQGTANGRRVRTAVEWTPREVSFVAVGADPRARTRSLERHTGRASINRQIRELGRRAGIATQTTDQLIDNEASVEEACVMFFDQMLTRGTLPIRVSMGTDYTDPNLQTRAVEDALYGKMTGIVPSGPASAFYHRSTTDLMAHCLRIQGVSLRSEDPAEIFRAAMLTRSAGGLHSTSDFPTVLGNTANRRLGELFKAAESGASAIAANGTVRDFRPITEARLTSFPSLEKLGENGEITWGTLEETGETLVISSHARGIGITFQVIVNDDLSAVDGSIRDIAFATAQRKAKLIVAALSAPMSDGNSLFHAAHANLANISTGPEADTLSTGRLALMKQTAPGSTEPLGLTPAILFVPAELQTEAEKTVAAITPASSDNVNPFAGKLQVAVEPRLTSATQWYLFASPSLYPTIRFLTLAGFEAPRFETSQEFDRLGTSYRVHWHCGAGPVDWRGAWKTAGA
jgi:hypothetical protein